MPPPTRRPIPAAVRAQTVRARTAAGIAWARAWRVRMKPRFDALDAAGAYAPERFS